MDNNKNLPHEYNFFLLNWISNIKIILGSTFFVYQFFQFKLYLKNKTREILNKIYLNKTHIIQERDIVNHVFNLDDETWFYLTKRELRSETLKGLLLL